MSDLEKINQRIDVQKAAMRHETIKRLAKLLAIVLVVVLAFACLEYIGFISDLFMVILIAITVCTGAFRAGRISNGFIR